MPSIGWLIWAFLLGLALPYLTIVLHFAIALSDWTPLDFDTGRWIARLVPVALSGLFLALMVRSALRRPTTSKPLTGLLVFLLGIGCIGLGLFTALKLGLLPGSPGYS